MSEQIFLNSSQKSQEVIDIVSEDSHKRQKIEKSQSIKDHQIHHLQQKANNQPSDPQLIIYDQQDQSTPKITQKNNALEISNIQLSQNSQSIINQSELELLEEKIPIGDPENYVELYGISMEANAAVYRNKSNRNRVVVKTFDIQENQSEGRCIRQENYYYDFIQMAKYNNNICQISSKFKDRYGNPCLIIEHFRFTFDHLIQRQNTCPFEEEFILRILYQLIETLDYLEQHKYAILSFSPFWIYITEQGNIKLGHFRTEVKEFKQENCRIRLFNEYDPPEITEWDWSDEGHIVYKTQCWGLGILAYQMCEKQMLVYKENKKTFTQDAIDQIKLSEYYSEDLRQLIIRMLTYDSNERPSFKELLKDKVFIKNSPMSQVYKNMDKIDCFRTSGILNPEQINQLHELLKGEVGTYNQANWYMNFILRITPEEFIRGNKGEKKTLKEKMKKYLQVAKSIVNFVVLMKTDKTEEPMGFFIPLSNWMYTQNLEPINRFDKLNYASEIQDPPIAFYFQNGKARKLRWKDRQRCLLESNDSAFIGISHGFVISNLRQSRDFCTFTEDYWQWPEDVGNAKIFLDPKQKNKRCLLISGGEDTTFRCTNLEVFHFN